MNLTNKYKVNTGEEYIFEYCDADSFDQLDISSVKQTYAVCFYNDKLVIGFVGQKNAWSLIGGTVEKEETFEQTLKREIQEESNMKILSYLPIGYQKVTDTRDNSFFYQLRYVCNVTPYGDFLADPDESITEIKLINPLEYKDYFDWGTIGDRIIKRALELKSRLK